MAGADLVNDAPSRKRALRERYRSLRRDLDRAQALTETAAACARCLELLRRFPGRPIASYLALPDELDLDALHREWWRSGFAILFPRVIDDGTLSWHALTSADGLRLGRYGIREPDPLLAPASALPTDALVLVPGLAFAPDGRRLGQGKGYYDRALASHRSVAIGVGYSCQRCDDLPQEAHDRVLDGVILGGEELRVPTAGLRA
jgi:5-formyltetrahydrofolate cyclo-ligase